MHEARKAAKGKGKGKRKGKGRGKGKGKVRRRLSFDNADEIDGDHPDGDDNSSKPSGSVKRRRLDPKIKDPADPPEEAPEIGEAGDGAGLFGDDVMDAADPPEEAPDMGGLFGDDVMDPAEAPEDTVGGGPCDSADDSGQEIHRVDAEIEPAAGSMMAEVAEQPKDEAAEVEAVEVTDEGAPRALEHEQPSSSDAAPMPPPVPRPVSEAGPDLRSSGVRGPTVYHSPSILREISPPGCTISLNRAFDMALFCFACFHNLFG